jgi:putative SOS response-associated peptidase YedK
MCGRYTQLRSWPELVELYNITRVGPPPNLPARYNVAPTQNVPIVRRPEDAGGRELVLARWGLIPFWAKDAKIGTRTINARAETVAEKPSFREAFKRRRCLVVADGFYEWQKRTGGQKQPYFISVASEAPFAFAGLWETWNDPEGGRVESCTIIVTEANEALRPIHDRMPVILRPDGFDPWLDAAPGDARAMLQPFAGDMTLYPVSTRVNNVRNDDAGCMERIG